MNKTNLIDLLRKLYPQGHSKVDAQMFELVLGMSYYHSIWHPIVIVIVVTHTKKTHLLDIRFTKLSPPIQELQVLRRQEIHQI